MKRHYTADVEHGGGAGGGYGGTYVGQIDYTSEHRAGSKANAEDCMSEWRRKHGRAGWVEVKTAYLVSR